MLPQIPMPDPLKNAISRLHIVALKVRCLLRDDQSGKHPGVFQPMEGKLERLSCGQGRALTTKLCKDAAWVQVQDDE